MQFLSQLFNARARAAVIQLLFGPNRRSMYLNEMSHVIGMSSRSIEVEVKNLAKLDLLVTQADRSRIYYSANRSNPACSPLEALVASSADRLAKLQEFLALSDVEFIFLPTRCLVDLTLPSHDLPIFVVQRSSARNLQGAVRSASQSVGLSLVPEFITVERIRQGLSAKDPHISDLVASEKTFVVGSDPRFTKRIQPSKPVTSQADKS